MVPEPAADGFGWYAGSGCRPASPSLPFLESLAIPKSVFIASVPFFICGFLLYGSLMAGMGAIAPNLREGNQSTFVLTLPLVFTIISIAQLVENPFSSFTTFLTLFPFTSPVVMLTRLSVGPVPAWQLILSIVLLVGMVVFVIRGVTNLFSSQYLLSGQKIKVGLFKDGLYRSPTGIIASFTENSRQLWSAVFLLYLQQVSEARS